MQARAATMVAMLRDAARQAVEAAAEETERAAEEEGALGYQAQHRIGLP
jgi:hypothetical protein